MPETSMKAAPKLSPGDARLLELTKRRFQGFSTGFELVLADGSHHRLGSGEPGFQLKLLHPKSFKALASFDEGIIANAYINGWFEISGDMFQLYDLRERLQDRHPLKWLWRFAAPALLGQVSVNKSAIHHHYERDPSFYLSFLDKDFHCYTQGIFESDDEDIAVAIRRKMDFILEQCGLNSGSRVLEVGPGWGSFARYAARKGVNVTGITISEQSLKFMNELAAREKLPITTIMADVLAFESEEPYDAIVLLGIMEHLPRYARVLKCFDRLLKPGGHVFLDASAFTEKYKLSSFITQHIYPGNHSFFVLHDFLKALAAAPFDLKGVWDDRHSYYLTFSHWAKRFDSNRDFVVENFDDADYRRFRLYLWGAAHCFLRNTLQCYRLVLQKHP